MDHITSFTYASDASASISETRLTPLTDKHQTVERFQLQTEPPAKMLSSVDGFGARVTTVFVTHPHRHLQIHAKSVVRLMSFGEPPDGEWRDGAGRPAEWMLPTGRTTLPDAMFQDATELRARATTPRAFVEEASNLLSGMIRYVPGVTHVGSSLEEVFRAGAGVCQDFTHAAIGFLRAAGLPARYVSGYLVPDVDRVEIGGHAWVEVWLGTTWWGFDPVQRAWVGDDHVRVAAGRDYDDVMPVRGVFEGPPEHELLVQVRVGSIAS